MKRSGIATLRLHGGKAPWWLLSRMKPLAKCIFEIIANEFGPNVILKRLADPIWFQALSMVLGFDWNSSGTTTTTCGVLKSVLNLEEHGICCCGGKGEQSRKTPMELRDLQNSPLYGGSTEDLVYASKMTAKIDNSAIQDEYQLYHHQCIFRMVVDARETWRSRFGGEICFRGRKCLPLPPRFIPPQMGNNHIVLSPH